MKTLKIRLIILCLLCVSTVGLPQSSGATFFMKKRICGNPECKVDISDLRSNKMYCSKKCFYRARTIRRPKKRFRNGYDNYLENLRKQRREKHYKEHGLIEDLAGETWMDIKGFDGIYKVSNRGRIKSIDGLFRFEKIIKSSKNKQTGYLMCVLCNNLVRKTKTVHRIVAVAFIPNPKNLPIINHKNGIKTDNRVVNLEWCTYSDNAVHAVKKGLIKSGEDSPSSKLTEEQVKEIRSKYAYRKYGNKRLAEEYGVSRSQITSIVTHKQWKNV